MSTMIKYLWHGTTMKNVKGIMQIGLLPRKSFRKPELMLGNGIYFTDDFCKGADLGGLLKNGEVCMVLAKVSLSCYYAMSNNPKNWLREIKFARKYGYNSIFCSSGLFTGKNVLTHNEWCVFNPEDVKIERILKVSIA